MFEGIGVILLFIFIFFVIKYGLRMIGFIFETGGGCLSIIFKGCAMIIGAILAIGFFVYLIVLMMGELF